MSLSSSESDSETSSLGFAAESDESPFVRKSRRRSLRQDAAARAGVMNAVCCGVVTRCLFPAIGSSLSVEMDG